MKPGLLITDFTGVYEQEGFLLYLQEKGIPYRLVGLGDIAGTWCYCDPEAEAEISRRLVPGTGERVRFLDSGDFHYVSGILAAREREPFSLVLVDNHPDDQRPAFGGVLSCGSWVLGMREGHTMMEEVWTLGPDRRLRNGAGTLDRPLESDISDCLSALEGKRIYLSIDKDVLSWEAARTDWSQGSYSLERVKGWLDGLLRLDVVAVDVCGELSPSKGATPEDLRVNRETNIELQEFIISYLDK